MYSYVADAQSEKKLSSTKKELLDLADSQAKAEVNRDSTTKPFSFGIKLHPTQLNAPLQQVKKQPSNDSKKGGDKDSKEDQV